MSDHDHDHDHAHAPITNGDEPAAAAACWGARGAARREGCDRPRGRARADRLARVPLACRRRAACRARLGRSGVQGAPARGRARRQRSSSVSIRGLRRSSSPSRTHRPCTTWSSARSARVTRRRCSVRRRTGTRAFPYRSRAVSDPRGVLNEFGVELDDDVELRVLDSTADIRYLVIPRRPAGSETMIEEELAALVTRDSMIGVAQPAARSL